MMSRRASGRTELGASAWDVLEGGTRWCLDGDEKVLVLGWCYQALGITGCSFLTRLGLGVYDIPLGRDRPSAPERGPRPPDDMAVVKLGNGDRTVAKLQTGRSQGTDKESQERRTLHVGGEKIPCLFQAGNVTDDTSMFGRIDRTGSGREIGRAHV